MFLFVFGLPGGFADWCTAVTAELVRRVFGPVELMAAETLEQLARQAVETGSSQAVVLSRRPGGRLRAALAENHRSPIVALDDPAASLVDLVVGEGVALPDAVQAVAGSCAVLMARQPEPGALILRRDRDWAQPEATAAAIARHFQLPIDAAAIADLVAVMPSQQAPQPDAGTWWNSLTPADRAMATGALLPFIHPPSEGEPPPIAWTHPLFFVGADASVRASAPIDITGRAHCLLCGPYIALPPGAWSLSLTMLFSRAAAEHEFLVEIHADGLLADGRIKPDGEGSATLAIDFALDESNEHPVALQVHSQRAAFDGTVSIIEATLAQTPAAADEVVAALVSADE